MTSTPEEPQKENSAADQAKEDLQNSAVGILRSTAAGAATGGAAGAAVGVLKGTAVAAVKTKTGRRAILAAAVVAMVPAVAAGTAIAVLMSSFSGQSNLAAAHAGTVAETVDSDLEDPEASATLRNSAAITGADPQVLAAIYKIQKEQTASGGVGPFSIDSKVIDKPDGIPAEEASSLDKSAIYVGSQLALQFQEHVAPLENSSLDAGAMDTRDSDGNGKRVIAENDEAKAANDEVREAYEEAISDMPLFRAGDIAPIVVETARGWLLGQQSQCTTTGDVPLGGQTTVNLDKRQLGYAQRIINQVAARGMPQNAAVIALATVAQESKFRMYWNPSVPGSKELTDDHDARGTDGFSVGLYQQQVNGNMYAWGTVQDAMDPLKSTDMFLDALEKVSGWEDMSISAAAQAVQVSAFPDAYAQWEGQSRQLVKDLKPTSGGYENPHEHADEEAEENSSPPSSGGSGDTSHLSVNTAVHKNVQAVEAAMIEKFASALTTMGDYRESSDDHGKRRAVDLMIANYKSPAGIKNGTEISKFLIDNVEVFGIDYLIWRDKIWLGKATGWKPYSGGGYGGMYTGNWNDTTLHNDHVHVSVTEALGKGGDYVYIPGEGATSDSPCAVGGVHGIGVGGSGEGDDYPFRDPVGECAWCDGITPSDVDPWTLYKRECVSFVAWRINQQMGWKEGEPYPFTPAKLGIPSFGNASQWKANLGAAGYVTDKKPTPGAIAWWGAFGGPGMGEAGHVAIVKEVHGDGTITIEQYNATPYEYSTQKIAADSVNGFIHVADTGTATK